MLDVSPGRPENDLGSAYLFQRRGILKTGVARWAALGGRRVDECESDNNIEVRGGGGSVSVRVEGCELSESR